MSRIDFVTGAPEKYMPLVEELGTIPDRIELLVSGYTTQEIQQTLSADDWSIARILAHMLSYTTHNSEFIHQIAWMTDPQRKPWDEAVEVADQDLVNKNGTEFSKALRKSIAKTVDLLSNTPDASWGRPGIVLGRGRRSLRQQLRKDINHLVEHVEQIEELLGASK